MDIKREIEARKEDAVLHEKNSLIDVDNVEITGEMCCHIR